MHPSSQQPAAASGRDALLTVPTDLRVISGCAVMPQRNVSQQQTCALTCPECALSKCSSLSTSGFSLASPAQLIHVSWPATGLCSAQWRCRRCRSQQTTAGYLSPLVLPSTRRGTGPILENSCCDPSNPLSRRHPHHCHDQLKGTLSSRATVLVYSRGCRLPHKGGMWSGDGPCRASGAPAASRVWIAPVYLDEQDA